MARRFFPGPEVSAALGQSFSFGDGRGPDASRIVIVGIAKDAKYDTLGEDPQPYVYRPFEQSYSGEMTLHMRTQSEAGNALAAVRREVSLLDKDLPLLDAMTMSEQIGFSLLPLRLAATVAGSLGLLGALLAALGVFGVVNYSVTQRTRELGIRVALGAQTRDVMRLILAQGLWLAIIGAGIGLAAAVASTRMLTSLLYGVSPLEPIVFGSVPLLLVTISLLASYLPARRATKVDPLVALRYE
jgi:putative ABC transport system permease protein